MQRTYKQKYTQGKQITNTRKDEKCENNQKYLEKVINAFEKYKKREMSGIYKSKKIKQQRKLQQMLKII